MILLPKQEQPETTDGDLRQAVGQPAGLGISLFRPYRHPRSSALAYPPREHRPLLPRHPPRQHHQQRSLASADRRLPPLGGSLRQQTPDPYGVGRKGGPQGRLRPSPPATPGAPPSVRSLLHPQEHGTGTLLPLRRSPVPGPRSPLPHPRPAAFSLHPLLLLHPR